MANFGYDPTGTGKYGVGVLWNGTSGINVLADGSIYTGDVNKLVNGKPPVNPVASTPSGNQGNQSIGSETKRKPPIAISVPGNIITEEAEGSELAMVEELFEDLSLFELMDMGRSETVLGQNINYQPIKNLSDIYFRYDPRRILALSGTISETESASSLKIGEFAVDGAISIDPLTGDLLIAVENMKDGFLVQVEIDAGGEIIDS